MSTLDVFAAVLGALAVREIADYFARKIEAKQRRNYYEAMIEELKELEEEE